MGDKKGRKKVVKSEDLIMVLFLFASILFVCAMLFYKIEKVFGKSDYEKFVKKIESVYKNSNELQYNFESNVQNEDFIIFIAKQNIYQRWNERQEYVEKLFDEGWWEGFLNFDSCIDVDANTAKFIVLNKDNPQQLYEIMTAINEWRGTDFFSYDADIIQLTGTTTIDNFDFEVQTKETMYSYLYYNYLINKKLPIDHFFALKHIGNYLIIALKNASNLFLIPIKGFAFLIQEFGDGFLNGLELFEHMPIGILIFVISLLICFLLNPFITIDNIKLYKATHPTEEDIDEEILSCIYHNFPYVKTEEEARIELHKIKTDMYEKGYKYPSELECYFEDERKREEVRREQLPIENENRDENNLIKLN